MDLAASNLAGSEARTLPRGAPITATAAAFATAVRAELRHISRSLSVVETDAESFPQATAGASQVRSHSWRNSWSRAPGLPQLQRREPPGLTLLGTLAAVQGSKRRLAFLAEVLAQVLLDEPMDGAAASAWLLDQLAAMLDQRSTLADPQGALQSPQVYPDSPTYTQVA